MKKKVFNSGAAELVKHTREETIMTFGPWFKNSSYIVIVGLGRVCKVEKGDKLDVVRMNFGRRYARPLLVYDNHARRQIYTLKRGQLAWVFGYMKVTQDTETKTVETTILAYGFQGWYVPKMLDIKNENYDLETIERLKEENETSMLTFLEDILGDKDDEENE